MIEWLLTQDPGPWTFGFVATISTVLAVAAMARMYCKYRSREGERRLKERMERMRLESERDFRRDVKEIMGIGDDQLKYMIERELALRMLQRRKEEEEERRRAQRGDH